MAYLDKNGLNHFFEKIKNIFVKKTEVAKVGLTGNAIDLSLKDGDFIILNCGDASHNI